MWDDHAIERILKLVHGDRAVLRTRWRGEPAVTRVLLAPVHAGLDALVRGVVTTGRGSLAGLPESVALSLEGFRVRSRLGSVPWLPEVLDAGVVTDGSIPGVRSAGPGFGYACVTLRWVEGDTLAEGWPRLDAAGRHQALVAVVRTLACLHAQGALFGDLKPENVVMCGGVARLIDLDTLRDVPAPDAPVVTRDLTARYAAPEQREQHLSYTASDVWAFGALATRLITGADPGAGVALPAPWDALVAACLCRDPHARIRSADLLAALAPPGAGPDATIRVAEQERPGVGSAMGSEVGSEALDRSGPHPLVSGGWNPPTPAEPAPRPRRRRAWVVALVLIFGLGVLGAGGAAASLAVDAYQRQVACDEAEARVPGVHDRLRLYKTDPELNRDGQVLDRIVADAAVLLDVCPESRAVADAHALAVVWDQSWHYHDAAWEPEAWHRADALLADGPRTADGHVARLYLDLGACKLHPEAGRRVAACDAIEGDLADVLRTVRDRDAWLRVEALWGAVMAWGRESVRQRDAGNGPGADRLLERASAACREAWSSLAAAPVNGRELVEDCALIEGRRGDVRSWTSWIGQEASNDLSDDGRLDDGTLGLAYTSLYPEACGRLRWDRSQRTLQIPGDAPLGGWEDLCQYAGLVAVGCPMEAEARQRGHEERDWWWGTRRVTARGRAQGDVPWGATLAALGSPEPETTPTRCGL